MFMSLEDMFALGVGEELPQETKSKLKTASSESEEQRLELELFRRVCRNDPLLEMQKKEAREPLYLIRYE